MQDIAVAAVRQSAALQNIERIAPWLYRLAVRQSLLHRRRLGRLRRLHQRYADRSEQPDLNAADPLIWLMTDEVRDCVRQAMHRLNPRDAELLMLKYSENWNYGQIAQHVGISHSAVESRLHRARQRLRLELTTLNSIEVTS